MQNTNYAELFGGVSCVKIRLVEAIAKARSDARLSCQEVDDLCGLPGLAVDALLPSCHELESEPFRINAHVFSLASFGLDLKLDSVLKPLVDLTGQQITDIAEDMRLNKSRAVSAMPAPGGGDSGLHNLAREQQVRVYVLLKVMEEIDAAS